jgi:uncharacterized membrane protein required for colicin V production
MVLSLNVTTASAIADVATLAVIGIFAMKAWKKGFVNCFLTFASGIVVLILAFTLASPILQLTEGWFGLQEAITDGIVGAFAKVKGFNVDISSASLEAIMQEKHLPGFLENAIISAGVEGVPQGTTLAMLAGGKLGEYASVLISFIAVYLLGKLAFKLLQKVLDKIIPKLPVIGKLDGWLGLLLGVLEGFLIVSAVVAVLALLPLQSVSQFFQNGLFVKWLYNKNLLHVVFGWFIN